MEKADEMGGSSVNLGEQNIVHDRETFIQDQLTMVDFNNDEDQHQSRKELNEMMIVTVVMEIIQKWKMNSQIHLSNLAQNTSKKIKQEVQKMFWLKMMMIEVKV